MQGRGEQLVSAAARVIHERGAAATTLAIVAAAADVPIGTVYYYFKTKDDLVGAVVAARLAELRGFLAFAEQHASPIDRLCAFVDAFAAGAASIALHGCMFGTLAGELGKEPGRQSALDPAAPGALLRVQLEWMETQFRALRLAPRTAHARAAELLCAIQGACTVAHALHDSALFEARLTEVSRALREDAPTTPRIDRKARSK